MAKQFIIPSVFTAVDQMSPKVLAMRQNVMSFGNSAEAALAKTDRIVRRLTPGLGRAQRELLGMVGTGALIAGAFTLGRNSFRNIEEYEVAVDSFRTIVSELNDTEFQEFQDKIDSVAKTSKRSGTEVAQAFEKIAGLNASFADTADGIGEVSAASITLAKAARMELGSAAENLVGIMNQFSFEAKEANRTINVLAAGQAVGAANISQTAEAFVTVGSVAAGANVSLEESVGLIQTLGKFSLFGAEAGTKLRGVILRLQKAGIGYASGQFDLRDALVQTNTALSKLSDTKKRDQIINKLFGAENVTAGRILLSNIETFDKFTQGVTDTAEAQKAAEINSGNLKTAVQELGAAWSNMLTSSNGSREGITKLTNAVHWLERNLDTVVSTAITAGKVFLLYKGSMMAARAALLGWNITLGISTALQGASSLAMKNNTVALAAQQATLTVMGTSLKGATAAQYSLNAAMAANPVGMLTLGIGALVAGIGYLIYRQRELNAEYERAVEMRLQRSYDGEIKAIETLTDRLVKLGHSYGEAKRQAIEFEMAENRRKQAVLKSEVESLRSKRDDISSGKDRQWTDMLQFGPFFNRKDDVQAELNAKMAQLTDAMKAGSAISDLAIGFTQQQKPKAPLIARESEKFTGSELTSLLSAPQSVESKNEITVRIKNDSDNPATVTMGRTKLGDVMPKTESTKTFITRAN